ncbi:MAG: PrsW family glutamic-type intramembrane protease [Chloroflexota bacterium]
METSSSPAAGWDGARPAGPAPSQPAHFDAPSLVQLVASLIGALGLLGLVVVLALQGLALFQRGNKAELLTLSLLAAGMAFCALLLLPSAWFSLLRLRGCRPMSTLPEKFPRRMALLLGLLVIVPVTLIAGTYIVDESEWAWLIMPPLQVIVVAIPIAWLIHLGCYHLPLGSAQRKWGIFSSSLVLGPLFIIGLEAFVGALLFGAVLALLLSQPGAAEALQRVAALFQQDSPLPLEQITPMLEETASALLPYLQRPIVAYAGIAFLVVIVPLLEEAVKPLSVWFLGGRKLTPPEGFAVGVLCGAGFAMMENFGYTAAAEGNWGSIALARTGTAVMHVVTSGIMGWALSSTWRDGRYLRIAFMYVTVVFVHGFWNGLTVSFGLLGTQLTGTLDSALLFQLAASGLLGLLLLVFLVALNGAMRRAIILPPERYPPAEISTPNEEYQNDGIPASTD